MHKSQLPVGAIQQLLFADFENPVARPQPEAAVIVLHNLRNGSRRQPLLGGEAGDDAVPPAIQAAAGRADPQRPRVIQIKRPNRRFARQPVGDGINRIVSLVNPVHAVRHRAHPDGPIRLHGQRADRSTGNGFGKFGEMAVLHMHQLPACRADPDAAVPVILQGGDKNVLLPGFVREAIRQPVVLPVQQRPQTAPPEAAIGRGQHRIHVRVKVDHGLRAERFKPRQSAPIKTAPRRAHPDCSVRGLGRRTCEVVGQSLAAADHRQLWLAQAV